MGQFINTFDTLGAFLRRFSGEDDDISRLEIYVKPFETLVKNLYQSNLWFTSENVVFALKHWGALLREKRLVDWIGAYALPVKRSKEVAVIMAGNVPLVGFHDFLCVLLSGHRILVKNTSSDDQLLPFLCCMLITLEPLLEKRIIFVDSIPKDFDAVIATGSNNTARYFEYYFRDHPQLIRKSRVSVAVLRGEESQKDLYGLAQDVLMYFGRGCRNVSKVFIPRHYDPRRIFQAFDSQSVVIENFKYARNYEYYQAIYLLDNVPFEKNDILLLKEDTSYHSPISVLFYEYYDDLQSVKECLDRDRNLLQCVIGHGIYRGEISFGQSQCPMLMDYADGVDTIRFLEEL